MGAISSISPKKWKVKSSVLMVEPHLGSSPTHPHATPTGQQKTTPWPFKTSITCTTPNDPNRVADLAPVENPSRNKTWWFHQYLGVSKNNGIPKSSTLMRFFHYKPSILGYPYFWKHPFRSIPGQFCDGDRLLGWCFKWPILKGLSDLQRSGMKRSRLGHQLVGIITCGGFVSEHVYGTNLQPLKDHPTQKPTEKTRRVENPDPPWREKLNFIEDLFPSKMSKSSWTWIVWNRLDRSRTSWIQTRKGAFWLKDLYVFFFRQVLIPSVSCPTN